MKNFLIVALAISYLAFSASISAAPLSFWAMDGWTLVVDDDGFVGPGGGGQAFDAEFLYYKKSGNTLFLGLQTGFDVIDGHQTYGSKSYYAGDLALSFDGNVTLGDDSTYEYGIDFGLYTEGYTTGNKIDTGSGTGIDVGGGLFKNVTWNNDVYSGHHESDPFALDDGDLHASLLSNMSGSGVAGGDTSYWRAVSFDLTGLGTDIDMHWTMSCGNDNINGGFSVPEPSIISLLGLGLLGLGFVRRRKTKA